MLRHLSIAFRMAVVTIVALGLAYPFVITGAGQVAFPYAANGSLARDAGGKVIGSHLIGQSFTSDRYFHGRPSASDYDGTRSGGSNLGPTSKKLAEDVATRAKAAGGAAPVDLLTSSGSGLDPDVSVASALFQVPRVAKARRLAEDAVRRLVEQHTSPRQLGFLGEPRVNVLELNLALDGKR